MPVNYSMHPGAGTLHAMLHGVLNYLKYINTCESALRHSHKTNCF